MKPTAGLLFSHPAAPVTRINNNYWISYKPVTRHLLAQSVGDKYAPFI
jgi:hypothetical protein